MARLFRVARLVAVTSVLNACGGVVDGSSREASPSAGAAPATTTVSATGGALPSSSSYGSAMGGSPSATAGTMTSGGGLSSAGASSTAGTTSSVGLQCAWEDIYCGGLSPTCSEGEAFVFVAACSGPCVATEKCPATWTAGQDALTVGTWLIGSEDDGPHYSVVRFLGDFTAEFSLPTNLLGNQSYFPCQGIGTWGELQRQGTIHLGAPDGCTSKSTGMRFVAFHDAKGRWGAAMRAEIFAGGTTQLEAYWFPKGICDSSALDCPL